MPDTQADNDRAIQQQKAHKDSYAPVRLEINYQQFADTEPVLFPSNDLLMSFTIKLSPSAAWTGTLNIVDRTERYFTGSMRPGTGARFHIKWNWDKPFSLWNQAPIYKAAILRTTPDYNFTGTNVSFELVGQSAPNASLSKDTAPRRFDPGKTATQIIKEIIDGEGWQTGQIEPSIGKLPGFVLGNQSHLEFITSQIIPRAINKYKEGMSFYFDAAGFANFHSPSYNVFGPNGNRRLAREYVYARDMAGEVLSFRPRDNTFFVAIGGGANGTYGGIDSNKGEGIELKHTSKDGVNGEGNPPATTSEVFGHDTAPIINGLIYPQPNSEPHDAAFNGFVCRDPEDMANKASAYYASLKTRTFEADLEVKGTHLVKIFDYIAVWYYQQNEKLHYLSGIFRVNSLEHTYDSGGWITRMGLMRQAAPQLPQESTSEQGKYNGPTIRLGPPGTPYIGPPQNSEGF